MAREDPGKGLHVEGQATVEGGQGYPQEIALKAYVFDRAGQSLGSADIDAKGHFSVPVSARGPLDVQVVVGPADDPQTIRKSAAFSQNFSAKDWQGDATRARLRADLLLPRDIVSLWWPQWICVTGHLRKIFQDGVPRTCPIPFTKVEIYDVDRENCWWPYLRRWWDVLIDRPVFRIPDLLKERVVVKPFPWPDPGPDPDPRLGGLIRQPLERTGINPTSIPLAAGEAMSASMPMTASSDAMMTTASTAALAESPFASRINKLTLTSAIAPWLIFPWCFYSRQLVCETTTDECGYFRCCFRWWPFHFRRGRFRFDARPDIIIKVTQVINGVSTVIYLDPYSSTRWNVGSTHVDLYVDNNDVVCGSCGDQSRPAGTAVFFTRIGNDEVYLINQTNGTYSSPSFPPTTNMAYGDWLQVHAQFGDTLSRAMAIPGATAPYYYRLSRSKDGTNFTEITTSLADTRVNKLTLVSDSHTLGPQTVGPTPGLYQIRDFANYYWYNPDWIGYWDTKATEPDEGTYILRLEVFDANGVFLDSTKVDYRDGTQPPPGVLPPMLNRCDLKITLDNNPPVCSLSIPAAVNDCGVVPWATAGTLAFNLSVTQPHNRINEWGLEYTKGLISGPTTLASGASSSGTPAIPASVSGAPLLVGLTTTCAFAIKLFAYAHVRNGFGRIYYDEDIKAIAIEKCS